MPARKRPNIGRLSAAALKQRRIRSRETSTERETRLNAVRDAQTVQRANQPEDQRQARQDSDRLRHALLRESETPSEHAARLELDRLSHAHRREAETDSDREVRRERDRRDHETSRARESLTRRQERLRQDRERHRASRQLSPPQAETSDTEPVTENFRPALRLWAEKERSGFQYDPSIDYEAATSIGHMERICRFCQALLWAGESKGLCCSSGKVKLTPLLDPPEPLLSLLNRAHPQSRHFLNKLRPYNSAFQMTSFGGNIIGGDQFMPTFKVQGQVYHRIGSLLPPENAGQQFLQLYFIGDYHQQANMRASIIPNLNSGLVRELQDMVHSHNPYVDSFKMALETVLTDESNFKVVISADRIPAGEHARRYNAPMTNEVAVILVNQECNRRDIVLRSRSEQLTRICETHRSYDALQYPLMFCRGEDGYFLQIPQVNPSTGQDSRKTVSALQFYCYRLMIKQGSPNWLHKYRDLLNQYCVDMYAKIQTERLMYIRHNQAKLRAESYVHLQDALRGDGDPQDMGQLIILPSSFVGGPRYMHQRTQDAFCYVRKYGCPDLFITATTNQKWPEIVCELGDGQRPQDRHDIVSRVFRLKLKSLMDLLTKYNIFGPARCHLYSVEWQKRGLPHAHILVWLQDKIRPSQVDSVICAELPDPDLDPELSQIVRSHMVHGPCGALNMQSPCMKNGRCTKKFPRQFTSETVTGQDGYPTYRRRSPGNGGFTALTRLRGQDIVIDNSWVVPYSPVLSRALKCHVNVELCSSVRSIKYICKYVNKGSDLATFQLENKHDEIVQYQSGRYISTSEAIWRILSFPIHERYPPVAHLDVHLENGQRVYFRPETVAERVEHPRNTSLMAFFQLCASDEFARGLLYEEVPSYYTFNKQRGVFCRRKQGTPVAGHPGVRQENVIGRVYTIHPSNAECFYLRMLLFHVKGPTSFEALRTVNGVLHPTYQAACRALNLLEADNQWELTLRDACVSECPGKLRQLFAVILVFCSPSDPLGLFNMFKQDLSEDVLRELRARCPSASEESLAGDVTNRTLILLESVVRSTGGQSLTFYGLPAPQFDHEMPSPEYLRETTYDARELSLALEAERNLNEEQKTAVTEILSSVENVEGKLFFLDAPGGTGKTFVIRLLLAKVRSANKIALAVASSGIAATLLPGGRTAHSTFKIPLELDKSEQPVCSLSRNSDMAKVICDCSLVVWDECTMANKKAVEALDRTLRDLRKSSAPMGGLTVLFSGDFRQILPVIPRGTRADEVDACLKRSYLWPLIRKLSLSRNMRVMMSGDTAGEFFSNMLLQVGNGRIGVDGEILPTAQLCHTVSTIEELIDEIYPDVKNLGSKSAQWLCERAILAPRNDLVQATNTFILSNCEGRLVTYSSFNSTMNQDDSVEYPVEFLQSISAPGLPEHRISLKVGAPIILLRNLNPPILCNGTRLIVSALHRNVIQATILTGKGRGESVFIPRIPIIPSNFPIPFKRLQFPVSLCFAMTINKAQGQTLRVAGLDLRTNCFSHGQLYVACSRVSSARDLYICTPEFQFHSMARVSLHLEPWRLKARVIDHLAVHLQRPPPESLPPTGQATYTS